MPLQDNPAIFLDNVSFAYKGEEWILKSLSLSLHQHESVGIIGPNGGGKSTFLKLLMGFLEPTLGKVEVFGTSPKEARSKIAWVPQTLHFDRHFPITLFELVLCGRLGQTPWFTKEDREIVQRVLVELSLEKLAKSPFAKLSGGQMQRALIARALVSNPELLLLDEPTAHVDAEAEEAIYQLLTSLKKRMTILLVTHDVRHAIDHVERVLCIQREARFLPKREVCSHFALGLYHSSLMGES